MPSSIKQIILENKFHILPLYSIRLNSTCSCGKADCSSPGKHPLFRYNWKIIASNKPEKVEEWFSLSHKMNFGLATGRKSEKTGKYLAVVDVDAVEHPIIKELSFTFHYRTGSGGWHFWFWTSAPIKNTASHLADKVDTRGQDGYVVIPPSKHIRGAYGEVSHNEIQDLPEKFLKALSERRTAQTTKKSTVVSSKQQSRQQTPLSDWSSGTVESVREKMKTEIVPVGVRNIVLHRLLSSDRAKGAERSVLEKNSCAYLKQFENYCEFFDEATQIIDSVMRYPAFNTSFEKVNEIYFSWLRKNKPNLKIGLEEVRALKDGDREFFSSLRPWTDKEPKSSLQEIIQARMLFLKKEKCLVHVSNYKPQLMAKKLESLGFTKSRTAKANLWNVALPAQIARAE